MKKILSVLLLIFSLGVNSFSQSVTDNFNNKKILIAYFTWADNTVPGNIDGIASPSVLAPGNVGVMAENIQEITGGDLFSIKTSELYPSDFGECLDKVHLEQDDNFYPQLKEKAENISDYDIIFLGYPNWGYTAPQALFSFLKEHDIHNKIIIPFCSHGTGGLANSVEDIKALLPDCEILTPLGINRDDIKNSYPIIKDWIENQLNFSI